MKIVFYTVIAMSCIFATFMKHVGACGGEVVAEEKTQIISSSNYPGNYSNNLECVWTFKTLTPGSQVEVIFADVFTEPCCDVITVRDGNSPSAPIIVNFRGNSSGGTYISTFGSFYVTFVSDGSISGRGFRLEYQEVTVDTGCEEELIAETAPKLLLSPHWPLDYPADVFCKWSIASDPENQIFLIVLVLRTESCCDSLTVRDGLSETSKLLGELRGTTGGQIFTPSRGNALGVRFRTDQAGHRIGFMARYFSVSKENRLNLTSSSPETEEECEIQLKVPEEGYEQIMSPGFPLNYVGDLTCVWKFVAPVGRRIMLWFNYVSTQTCCDWLKIRDGSEHTSPKLGILSGDSDIFHSFVSSGNTLRLEFDSDSFINNKGFSAFYEIFQENEVDFICGGYLRANSSIQYISSPNWPEAYNDDTNCTWTIEANPAMQVRLQVLGAITEKNYDRIVVFDGNSTKEEIIFYWSGKSHMTSILNSTSSTLTLTFTSDYAVHLGGFRAAYTEQRIFQNEDDVAEV